MCKSIICKFYEADINVLKEAKEIEAAERKHFGNEEWEAMQSYEKDMGETLGSGSNSCDGCYGCKHFSYGDGYPGEDVYYCSRSGNEHIIEIDFNF